MSLAALNRTMQAGEVLLSVGSEAGLTKVTDPFASKDPLYQRLITLLNTAGNELLDLYPWTRLQSRFSFVTIEDPSNPGATQLDYGLPADWNCMIDQTMWKKGGLYPGFPITPQSWQYLANVKAAITIQVIFRERLGVVSVAPGTPIGLEVNMEYESRGWVQPAASTYATAGFADRCAQFSDVILHDPTLMTRYLRMKFLEALGFDTQKATDDFNFMLESRQGKDKSAPILNVGRPGAIGPFRLIDGYNAPQTGFGGSGSP